EPGLVLDPFTGEHRGAGARRVRPADLPALDALGRKVRAQRVVAVSVGLAQPPGEVLAGSEVLIGVAAVDHRRTRCRYRGGVVLIPAGVGLGENGVAVA